MRSFITLTAVVAAAAILATAPAGAQVQGTTSVQAQVHQLRAGIGWHRARTWHYQDEAGVRRTPTEHVERRTTSVLFLRWIEHRWSQRRLAARRFAARHPAIPHETLWLCIHKGEGSWSDEDSGGNGHYGGLQMHAGWGYGTSYYASEDSPTAQMEAAERGYRASGYSTSWLYQQWGADAHCFA